MFTPTRFTVLLAAAFFIALSCFSSPSLAQSGAEVEATFCKSATLCATNPTWCPKRKFPVNTCINRFGLSGRRNVKLACSRNQTICVNASVFSDAGCSEFFGSISSVCTTCTEGKLQFDCGGLPMSMFVLSNCGGGSSCGNCNTTITPFRKCKNLPGLGYSKIFGEYQCSAITVTEFSDDACTQQIASYQLPDGQCFEGTKVKCLA